MVGSVANAASGNVLPSGQRVLRRQPRDHGVGVQRDPVKVALAEARDAKSAVCSHTAARHELAAVALQDLHLDAGVNFAKRAMQRLSQP